MPQKFCPICGATLRLQGVSIAHALYFCEKCKRTFEVIKPAVNMDAQEGAARVSHADIMKGRMIRE